MHFNAVLLGLPDVFFHLLQGSLGKSACSRADPRWHCRPYWKYYVCSLSSSGLVCEVCRTRLPKAHSCVVSRYSTPSHWSATWRSLSTALAALCLPWRRPFDLHCSRRMRNHQTKKLLLRRLQCLPFLKSVKSWVWQWRAVPLKRRATF